MRRAWILGALVGTLFGGCLPLGSCPSVDEVPLRSASLDLIPTEYSRFDPDAGARAELDVEAGSLVISYSDDDGKEVVETWELGVIDSL